MLYTISFTKQAFKDLDKISEPFYSNIKQAIINLSVNPRPNGFKKLKGREGFRIRIGNYRVIYNIIDSELVIEVIALGHRKNIYD
jgi:mRNA interferase RelE/StbE